MKKRKCEHPLVRYTWGLRHHPDGSIAPDVALAVHCTPCGTRLSLGPSNDADVPADEIIAAVCAHSDADHEAFEVTDGVDWDVARPLAEQWPWNGERLIDGMWTRAQVAEMAAEEDRLRAQYVAERTATEAHLELTGPTDQGHPIGGMTGTLGSQLDALDVLLNGAPKPTLKLVDSFAPEDSATIEPWHAGAETMDSDELVETVAYCPPGSVRE